MPAFCHRPWSGAACARDISQPGAKGNLPSDVERRTWVNWRYNNHRKDGMMMAANHRAAKARIFLSHARHLESRAASPTMSLRYLEKTAKTAPIGASQGVTVPNHPLRILPMAASEKAALAHGAAPAVKSGTHPTITLRMNG